MNTVYSDKARARGEEELLKNKEMNNANGDVYINKYTKDCALMAAGASIECCKRVFLEEGKSAKIDSAFAAIRPPGHHAACTSMSGFCFLNNVAIACEYIRNEMGKKKVVIFDWDIHCGDGTS